MRGGASVFRRAETSHGPKTAHSRASNPRWPRATPKGKMDGASKRARPGVGTGRRRYGSAAVLLASPANASVAL